MDKTIDLVGSNMNISEEAKNILRSIPVEILAIPSRAKKALIAGGVKNVLNAIEVIKSGFEGIPKIGNVTISESVSLIDELLAKIEHMEPDIILNALDPRESYLNHTNGNILQVFPQIIDLYFEKSGGKNAKRDKQILCKRFNLDGDGKYTLDDIGAYFNLTRERVRQIETKIISDLNLLLSGEFKNKKWKLDFRLVNRYLALKEELHEGDFILSAFELDSYFKEEFGGSLSLAEFRVFMAVLGYFKLPKNIVGFRGKIKSGWYLPDLLDRKEIESIFQALDVIFDITDLINKFDLFEKVKRESKIEIADESMLIALKSCEEIEIVNDIVSIKFNYLKNAADMAYRLLTKVDKPLHFSALCEEINLLGQSLSTSFKPISRANLHGQLVIDERFNPIGKSGSWGLSKWTNYENITIVDAIESVLNNSGTPLSFSQITQGVREIRPGASKKTLLVYLTSRATKFTRVSVDLYALASWQMTPLKKETAKKVSNKVFYDVAKLILEQQNPIPLQEFIEKMSNMTGLKEPNMRVRINESPIIKTRNTIKRHKEVYCDDVNFSAEESGLVKPLLRERIQDKVRSILYENPNTPIKKSELYNLVNKEVPCQRPTFYQYLDKASDIKQYKEGNFYYAVHEESEVK